MNNYRDIMTEQTACDHSRKTICFGLSKVNHFDSVFLLSKRHRIISVLHAESTLPELNFYAQNANFRAGESVFSEKS